MVVERRFPALLHVCGYDVRGVYADSGMVKPARASGIVEHTHQLLAGLARARPATRFAVTQTGGAARPAGPARPLRLPEGPTVDWRSIVTAFPAYLRGEGAAAGKDPGRVTLYYETRIDDEANPVWRSLAEQYTAVIRAAGTADLLLQGVNPLVALLKADECGLLDAGRLRVTAVVHDTAGAQRRLGYLARRLAGSGLGVMLVAVSGHVRAGLLAAGVPARSLTTIRNGLDVAAFDRRLAAARGVFARVAARNGLRPGRRVVLVSARRVPWKGQRDVIDAAGLLAERGRADTLTVVINGAGMTDSRWPGYERELAAQIDRRGLGEVVVLLDALTAEEVAACYTAAHVAVHPSREPEPFGYATVEAMLAGVPVITTGHGGPAEYIADGRSGLFVPPGAPGAIAAALERLLGDDGLRGRVAAAGRAAAARLSLETMTAAYLDLIARPVEAATATAVGR